MPAPEPDILDRMTDDEARALMLSKLDEEERAIVLEFERGESGKGIAKKLGKSPSWVSKKMAGIRAKVSGLGWDDLT
jgi:DNA-binding NarL/FixJ family response regulator